MTKFLWLLISIYIYADACARTVKVPKACGSINLNPINPNCSSDITISLDFSTAMLSSTNIQALGNFVVNRFVPSFPISPFGVEIAVQVFGTYGITNSVYFNDYTDVCNYVHAQMENSDQLGMSDVLLVDVLTKYYDDLLSTGREGYPQNLILFTAINDPIIINASVEISREIQEAGVAINIIGINQPGNSTLSQLATFYYPIDNFSPYDQVISWTSENVCPLNGSDEGATTNGSMIRASGVRSSLPATMSTMLYAPIIDPFFGHYEGMNGTESAGYVQNSTLMASTSDTDVLETKNSTSKDIGQKMTSPAYKMLDPSYSLNSTNRTINSATQESMNSSTAKMSSMVQSSTTLVILKSSSSKNIVRDDTISGSTSSEGQNSIIPHAVSSTPMAYLSTIDLEVKRSDPNLVLSSKDRLNSAQAYDILTTIEGPMSSNPTSNTPTTVQSGLVQEPMASGLVKDSKSIIDYSTTIDSITQNSNELKEKPNQTVPVDSSKIVERVSTTQDTPKNGDDLSKQNPENSKTDSQHGLTREWTCAIFHSNYKPHKSIPVLIPASTINHNYRPSTQNSIVPEMSEKGTPCAMNSKNAWIDIAIVVEVSNAMTETALNGLGASLADLVLFFNLNQSQIHSSRFALITFNSEAVIRFDFKRYQDEESLIQAFMDLKKYMTNDPIANMANALNMTNKLLYDQRTHRRPVVILAASTYAPEYSDPMPIAKLMSASDIFISTLNYAPNNLVATDGLGRIANAFMNFSDEGNVQSKLSYALVSANCMCELGKQQIQYYTIDPSHKNITYYSDCFMGYKSGVAPALAEQSCENINGHLVMEVSRSQNNFVHEKVVLSKDLLSIDDGYTIGLHKNSSGSWAWYGNGGQEFELDANDYQNWCTSDYIHAPVGSCVYANYENGTFCWTPSSRCRDGSFALPYVCQFRSCDTDHFKPGCAWNKEA